MNLTFKKTELPEVIHIKPSAFEDSRGWLCEFYNKKTFSENGITEHFIQGKHSVSKRNVLRGLHFQREPHSQGKLVRCSYGKIFDVVVDIRPESPNRGKWIGVELSSDNRELLYVPVGFAHGFVVLNEEAHFTYLLCSSDFNPEADAGLIYNDPEVNIHWPVDIKDVIISEKDKNLPTLKNLVTSL